MARRHTAEVPAALPCLPAHDSPLPLYMGAHAPPLRLLQGTQRGAAAGFKLDTLLKLADVKGTDRKTSLLHFVITQARPRQVTAGATCPHHAARSCQLLRPTVKPFCAILVRRLTHNAPLPASSGAACGGG